MGKIHPVVVSSDAVREILTFYDPSQILAEEDPGESVEIYRLTPDWVSLATQPGNSRLVRIPRARIQHGAFSTLENVTRTQIWYMERHSVAKGLRYSMQCSAAAPTTVKISEIYRRQSGSTLGHSPNLRDGAAVHA